MAVGRPDPPTNYVKEANNTLRDIIAIGGSLAVIGGAAAGAYKYYQTNYATGTQGSNYGKQVPINRDNYKTVTQLSTLPHHEEFSFTPFDSMIEASNNSMIEASNKAMKEYEFNRDFGHIDPVYEGPEPRPVPPIPAFVRPTYEPAGYTLPLKDRLELHTGFPDSKYSMYDRRMADKRVPLTFPLSTKRPGEYMVSDRVSRQH